MLELFSTLLPYKVLFSHILLPVLVLAIAFRAGWGETLFSFMGKHAVLGGFLLSVAAIVGSLFYSEVVGYEPCTLCWWIRVFLYPQALMFGVALLRGEKGRDVFSYALPLTLIALFISLYFSYYSIGGVSLFPCTADEGACSRVFVREFSYVTIPMMSFTICAYLLLLTWVNNLYVKEDNSNA